MPPVTNHSKDLTMLVLGTKKFYRTRLQDNKHNLGPKNDNEKFHLNEIENFLTLFKDIFLEQKSSSHFL